MKNKEKRVKKCTRKENKRKKRLIKEKLKKNETARQERNAEKGGG